MTSSSPGTPKRSAPRTRSDSSRPGVSCSERIGRRSEASCCSVGTRKTSCPMPTSVWCAIVAPPSRRDRDSNSCDHIRITIFEDHIEFESPGRFPGIVDLTNPESLVRFARNPRIARVCADLRFGQEFIQRMIEEMRLAGLADPEYHQTSGSVQLVLRASKVDRGLDARLPLTWRPPPGLASPRNNTPGQGNVVACGLNARCYARLSANLSDPFGRVAAWVVLESPASGGSPRRSASLNQYTGAFTSWPRNEMCRRT